MNEDTRVRKIVRTLDSGNLFVKEYEARKPAVFASEGWEEHGRRYNIKGIDNLVSGNTFTFEIEPEVERDLQMYREIRGQKQERYSR